MDPAYLSPQQLITRDLPSHPSHPFPLYQIQSDKSLTTATIVNVGHHTTIPLVPILSFPYDHLTCRLLSFTLLDQDLHDDSLKMIGFIIQEQDNIIGALEFHFVPSSPPPTSPSPSPTPTPNPGTFTIYSIQKKNSITHKIPIKTFTEYPGRDESIHILTSTLIEDGIIETFI